MLSESLGPGIGRSLSNVRGALLRSACDTNNYWANLVQIVVPVADYYRVRRRDVLGPQRHRHIARPRHVAQWIAARITSHSRLELARFFKRDPGAILNAERQIDRLLATQPHFVEELRAVLRLIDLPQPADLFAISEPRCTKAAHPSQDGPPVSETPLTLV
jgi:hypothetical protein